MKKDDLLGMEVYYEDNPEQCEPRGHKGHTGEQGVSAPDSDGGVWVFGDSSEGDDLKQNWDLWLDEDDEEVYEAVDEKPCIPIRGRIYKIKGLNLIARLKQVRPLTATAGIFEMDRHGHRFYIDPSYLMRANITEVEEYLED